MTMAGAFCWGSIGHGGSLELDAKSLRRPSSQTLQMVTEIKPLSMTTAKGVT